MCCRRFVSETDTGHGVPNHDRTAWLKGSEHRCLMPPPTSRGTAPRILILESPDAGRKIQIEMLCEELGVCRLSVSDVIESAGCCSERKLTPAMQNALDYLQRGDFVPDETVLNLMGERLHCLQCTGGFVLDGFPRTVPQAKALEQLLENHGVALTAVLNYVLPTEIGTEACHQSVRPLIDFYRRRGLLVTIDASGTAQEIHRQTMNSIPSS